MSPGTARIAPRRQDAKVFQSEAAVEGFTPRLTWVVAQLRAFLGVLGGLA